MVWCAFLFSVIELIKWDKCIYTNEYIYIIEKDHYKLLTAYRADIIFQRYLAYC